MRPSITRRITLVTMLATITLLGGFGIYLDRLFGQYQERDYLNQIESHLRFIRSELDSVEPPGEFDTERAEIAEIEALLVQLNRSESSDPFHVIIFDERMTPLLEMESAVEVLNANAPFPPGGSDLNDIATQRWTSPTGQHLILSSVTVDTPKGQRHVHGVLDWTHDTHQHRLFRIKSLLALTVAAILAALAGAIIARRALEPVRELARAADRIDVSSFKQPFERRSVPVELLGLVRSLSSMQKRLDASFTSLSAFATDLAHEFRTPLNNLMGEITVALAHPREEEEYRDILGSALEECQRLTRMIEGLLFVARADRGGVSLRARQLDLASEIESVVEYYELSAEERGITILVNGSATITADKDLLRQAIANLLANAVQYIEDGNLILVDICRTNGEIEISVSDDGPGIPQEEISDAFQRFSRGASARKARSEGSGMGLAIVRSIARLHGGDATIESKPGQGTRVTLRLPVTLESPAKTS